MSYKKQQRQNEKAYRFRGHVLHTSAVADNLGNKHQVQGQFVWEGKEGRGLNKAEKKALRIGKLGSKKSWRRNSKKETLSV